MLPSSTGGANWQGGAVDPETNIAYVFSNTNISVLGLVPGTAERNLDFEWVQGAARDPAQAAAAPAAGRGAAPGDAPGGGGARGAVGGGGGEGGEGGGRTPTVQGLPLVKPPYGRITALDLNKGELVWQIAHGETPDNIRNHPALKGLKIPRTGRQGRLGVLATKTLLIAGEGGFFTTPNGQRGAMLRAYDKATGREIGEVYMPAPQTGSPMTYMLNGRQYLTVSISGQGYSAELLAFRLPPE
jgi:quinoprotein glucose dehydrogenase